MSPFQYPGSKARVSAMIKSYFPLSFSEYREPFVGGGGVFWTMPSSLRRWANDRNRQLIAVYEALKSRPRELYERCTDIAPAFAEDLSHKNGATASIDRLRETFNRFKTDEQMDQALRYLFLNRCGWNGRVVLDPARHSRTSFTNAKGWSPGFFAKLETAALAIADAKVTCSDFEELFDEPGSDVLIFADPPYMKDTEAELYDKLYEFGFTLDDHTRLRDSVDRCKHRVVLSYDDHPTIGQLYRDYFVHEESWRYLGRRDRKVGQELIITNFPVGSVGQCFDD